MKVHGLKVPASLLIVFWLLLSTSVTLAFAGLMDGEGETLPEFPVGPEIITGTAVLAMILFLRRKNRSK